MGTADNPSHSLQGPSVFLALLAPHSGRLTRIQAVEGIEYQGRGWPHGPEEGGLTGRIGRLSVSLLGLSSGQASMATALALPSVPWLCQTLRRGAGASGAAKQRLRRSPETLGDERRKWGGCGEGKGRGQT